MLARTGMLCNRQSQLSLVASRCAFRGLSQGANPSGSEPGKLPAASQPDDDAPSTSAAASVGWLRGPEQNKPRKLVFDEWEEVRDPATGDVAWRSILTGAHRAREDGGGCVGEDRGGWGGNEVVRWHGVKHTTHALRTYTAQRRHVDWITGCRGRDARVPHSCRSCRTSH